jgi:hypothetical protein
MPNKLLDKLTFTKGPATAMPVRGGGDTAQAPKLPKLPICLPRRGGPTGASGAFPRHDRRQQESGQRTEYTEYQGVGHDSRTPTYRNGDVLEWLSSRRKEVCPNDERHPASLPFGRVSILGYYSSRTLPSLNARELFQPRCGVSTG